MPNLESGGKPVGSQRAYTELIETDVLAEMRDGLKLAVDVHRPDAPGRFPALVSMTPYNKAIERTTHLGPEIGRFSLEYAPVEAGDSTFWAERGYAHVIADIRGTGQSEGRYLGLFAPQEARDGYDLVEWVAAQDWCDGNVGMVGLSYLAITQFMTAAERPPHLKAIFPLNGFTDLYRHLCYHGGIPSRVLWFGHMAITGRDTVSVASEWYDGAELRRKVDALLADEGTNLANSPAAIAVLRSPPETRPIVFDGLIHPEDGRYWRERSSTERLHEIDVPAYVGAEMHAHPTPVHLAGAPEAWAKLMGPKKLAFRACNHGGLDRPFHQHHEEMLRWYDHWLKGIDTGIMDEPPVKVWVRGREQYRYSDEWPLLADTEWTRVYLRANGRLTIGEPPSEPEDSARLDYEPNLPAIGGVPISPPPASLGYVTEPFPHDVEVVGPLALHLRATLTQEDGDFIVSIRDVAPDGSEYPLSRGWLRASHRALDPERSQEWQPYHPHTDPTPVVPNERNEFAIELRPIANLFRVGHRLKLEIWPCDHPGTDGDFDWTQFWGFVHHIPYGKPVTYQVHHDPDDPSYLVIPVIRSEHG